MGEEKQEKRLKALLIQGASVVWAESQLYQILVQMHLIEDKFANTTELSQEEILTYKNLQGRMDYIIHKILFERRVRLSILQEKV